MGLRDPDPPGARRGPFPALPHVQLSVYLSEAEAHSYRAGKVLYNCLLADLFAKEDRPVKGSFENGWPSKVLAGFTRSGYGLHCTGRRGAGTIPADFLDRRRAGLGA